MKKIISLLTVAIVALVVSGCGTVTRPDIFQEGGLVPATPATTENNAPATTNVTAPKVITIQSYAFSEPSVTVVKGTEITWTNNDSAPHQIKLPSVTLPIMNPGQSTAFTFNEAGTFSYACTIHPSMTGKVIVQ